MTPSKWRFILKVSIKVEEQWKLEPSISAKYKMTVLETDIENKFIKGKDLM